MAAEQVAQVLKAMIADPAVVTQVEAGRFEALDARGLTAYERALLRTAARHVGGMNRHPSTGDDTITIPDQRNNAAVRPVLRYARFHLADRESYIDLCAWAREQELVAG
jgi:hypothetical protein